MIEARYRQPLDALHLTAENKRGTAIPMPCQSQGHKASHPVRSHHGRKLGLYLGYTLIILVLGFGGEVVFFGFKSLVFLLVSMVFIISFHRQYVLLFTRYANHLPLTSNFLIPKLFLYTIKKHINVLPVNNNVSFCAILKSIYVTVHHQL